VTGGTGLLAFLMDQLWGADYERKGKMPETAQDATIESTPHSLKRWSFWEIQGGPPFALLPVVRLHVRERGNTPKDSPC